MTSLDETGNTRPAVALIAGATASGKSGLAVSYARWLEARGQSAVIINADSAQVYADLQVLSARPGADDMGGICHRLFGYIDGAEACSAARWAKDARAEITAAHGRGALPILVGGTGLYLRTLIDGIAPVPPIDPEVRQAVRALPVQQAYAALCKADAKSAARLNPADSTRIARALEIIRATGHTIAHWQAHKTGGIGDDVNLHPLILLPPRDWLFARCNQRFAAMLTGGGLAEVAALLARQLAPDLPVMRAIGVPDIARLLREEIDHERCVADGQLATRQYAKRQYTWFRNQPPQAWKRLEQPVSDNIRLDFDILFQ